MLEIRRDAAVRVIVNNGFSEEEAVKAAQNIRRHGKLKLTRKSDLSLHAYISKNAF